MDVVPYRQLVDDIVTLDGNALRGRRLAEGLFEEQRTTEFQLHRRRAEGAGADFRTGNVNHDRDVRCECAHSTQASDAGFEVTVGEAQTENIHSSGDEGLNAFI